MIDVNWSAVIGTAGGICSATSFFPQMLKVRRQGGRDLSMAMLALLLSGAILWFAYGLINHATAVLVTNVAVIGLVSTTMIMKMVLERRGSQRRQRIAIDMDEVMADALTEHLRRYNAAYGTSITASDLSGCHLEQWIPPAHRAAAEAMLDASFFADLAVMTDCQEVVRELVQRTLAELASAVPRFDPTRGSFRGYLFGIARHRLIDHLRSKARARAVEPLRDSIADCVSSPSQQLAHRERDERLLAALRRIPLDFQITLELHYWEEMSVADIAVALAIAEGTVKSRLSRGRAHLRRAIAEDGAAIPEWEDQLRSSAAGLSPPDDEG